MQQRGSTKEKRKYLKEAYDSRRGSNSARAKLEESDVKEIKRRLLQRDRIVDIAADFNVSKATISQIRREKTWTHVPWR